MAATDGIRRNGRCLKGTGIFVGIGSNLPDPRHGRPLDICRAAVAALADDAVTVLAVSDWYTSAPVPASDQPWFVNGVAAIATDLDPVALLARLHGIETAFGRVRDRPNGARTLDLDLLAYADIVRDSAPRLPHPRLQDRAFVLVPLADVAPGWRHPVSGATLETLLDALPAGATVRRLD